MTFFQMFQMLITNFRHNKTQSREDSLLFHVVVASRPNKDSYRDMSWLQSWDIFQSNLAHWNSVEPREEVKRSKINNFKRKYYDERELNLTQCLSAFKAFPPLIEFVVKRINVMWKRRKSTCFSFGRLNFSISVEDESCKKQTKKQNILERNFNIFPK